MIYWDQNYDLRRKLPEIEIDDDGDVPPYVSSIARSISTEVECHCECTINVPLLRALTGQDPGLGCDVREVTVELNAPVKEQVRRHKKKRINKKWAKRYGYRTVLRPCRLTDARINFYGNNEFEITAPWILTKQMVIG